MSAYHQEPGKIVIETYFAKLDVEMIPYQYNNVTLTDELLVAKHCPTAEVFQWLQEMRVRLESMSIFSSLL
jgi:hypothetical protein